MRPRSFASKNISSIFLRIIHLKSCGFCLGIKFSSRGNCITTIHGSSKALLMVHNHKHSIFINMNATYLVHSYGNFSCSGFSCPATPQFTWDSKHVIYRQIGIAVTATVCPLIIFLNMLVIVAVKKVKELQKGSNILIASLAMADLSVGSLSIPLAISLDALFLQGNAPENIICKIRMISVFLMYSASGVSFFHLILIAWERYVAIVKCTKSQVLLAKGRVKRYAIIAWIAPVMTTLLYLIIIAIPVATSSLFDFHLAVDVISSLVWFLGMTLMVYFYSMVCIETRKRRKITIRRVNSLIKACNGRRIAFTVFLPTMAVLISTGVVVVFYILARFLPFWSSSSVLRVAETFLQLNSLVNPAIYFYRNRQCRKAAIRILRFGIPHTAEPVVRKELRARRKFDFIACLDVGERMGSQRATRLRQSKALAVKTHRHRYSWCGVSVSTGVKMERRNSAPS